MPKGIKETVAAAVVEVLETVNVGGLFDPYKPPLSMDTVEIVPLLTLRLKTACACGEPPPLAVILADAL
jgi:hypothetical protein